MHSDLQKSCKIANVSFHHAPRLIDDRGCFRKVFPMSENIGGDPSVKIAEIFYSESNVGVIRGMHVQVGLASNYRYIFVLSGSIFDVLIDLRPNSESYGEKFEFLFDSKNNQVLCLPPGVAHGFQALTSVTVGYAATSPWEPGLDTGVNAQSIGVAWPIDRGLMSQRDRELPSFGNWEKHLIQLERSHGN